MVFIPYWDRSAVFHKYFSSPLWQLRKLKGMSVIAQWSWKKKKRKKLKGLGNVSFGRFFNQAEADKNSLLSMLLFLAPRLQINSRYFTLTYFLPGIKKNFLEPLIKAGQPGHLTEQAKQVSMLWLLKPRSIQSQQPPTSAFPPQHTNVYTPIPWQMINGPLG